MAPEPNEPIRRKDFGLIVSVGYGGLLAFAITGLIVSLFARIESGPIQPIVQFAILLVGSVGLLHSIRLESGDRTKTFLLWVAIATGGFVVEVIGVKTGLIFGSYSYIRGTWPPAVSLGGDSFPLSISLAWLFIIAGANCSAAAFGVSQKLRPLVAAFIAAAGDLTMERIVTADLHLWSWNTQDQRPEYLHNFIGWFWVSLLLSYLTRNIVWKQATSRRWIFFFYFIFIWVSGLLFSIAKIHAMKP